MLSRLTTLVLTAAVAVNLAVPAPAQRYRNMDERQARLSDRIERGVRRGDLTRPEAAQLRDRFLRLQDRERDYRRSDGGLSKDERADLDMRFDRLSQRIYDRRRDHDYGRDEQPSGGARKYGYGRVVDTSKYAYGWGYVTKGGQLMIDRPTSAPGR